MCPIILPLLHVFSLPWECVHQATACDNGTFVIIQHTYWFISTPKYFLSTTSCSLCYSILPLSLKLSIFLVLLVSVAIQRLQHNCEHSSILINVRIKHMKWYIREQLPISQNIHFKTLQMTNAFPVHM